MSPVEEVKEAKEKEAQVVNEEAVGEMGEVTVEAMGAAMEAATEAATAVVERAWVAAEREVAAVRSSSSHRESGMCTITAQSCDSVPFGRRCFGPNLSEEGCMCSVSPLRLSQAACQGTCPGPRHSSRHCPSDPIRTARRCIQTRCC